MVHSLCSAYHWDYDKAMHCTLPQIIMLNYEAWAENDRWERKHKRDEYRRNHEDKVNPVVDESGNRMEDIMSDPERLDAYMLNLGQGLGNFDV